MSGQYAPVRDLDVEEDGHNHEAPDFPQAEPFRGSTETLVPGSTTPPGTQYARVPADQAGNGRAHIRPAFTHQRTGSSGAYADPWSPGYQRNKGRFSLGSTQELHSADQSKRFSRASLGPTQLRHASTGTPAPPGPPVSKWQNFKLKFQGHRIRERGHEVPGLWASLKAIVTCSWLNILFVFIPLAWVWGWKVAQPFVKDKKKSDYEDYVYLFILSFIAIIPLENICEFAGEQLALYCGESIGDLIIITLHNVAPGDHRRSGLVACPRTRSSFSCWWLKNLGAKNLKPRVTELNQSLLTVGVLALVVPAAFYTALPISTLSLMLPSLQTLRLLNSRRARPIAQLHMPPVSSVHAMEVAAQVVAVSDSTRGMILSLSRGISVILFVIYIGSRIYLHNPPGEGEAVAVHDAGYAMTPGHTPAPYFDQKRSTTPPMLTLLPPTSCIMTKIVKRLRRSSRENKGMQVTPRDTDGHHKPEVGPWPALVLLIISVGMITVTAECLVVAIKPIREQVDEKKMFTDEAMVRPGLAPPPFLRWGWAQRVYVFHPQVAAFTKRYPSGTHRESNKYRPCHSICPSLGPAPCARCMDRQHAPYIIICGRLFLVNSVTQDGRTNWSEGLIRLAFYHHCTSSVVLSRKCRCHFLSYCKSIEELLSF
ncbi:vacuolar calcium ion transporter [Rhizoctonia solani]|uniref:Vacuolar calcium ion transporter n=1 Tax=Rhizoctonia solani TaxID=456999 RepID=A0A8H8SYN4_9AGAM|nr:vacuolar calcium ion transporter [Rhizoctonia solani]QRW23426.1 vacuolar calcium ion transporter [Rhizoctonia solani]